MEKYLAGVSVRRVEDITGALWGTRVSPSTVNELYQKIAARIERNRPLSAESPYVYLNCTWLKRCWGGEVRTIAMLVPSDADAVIQQAGGLADLQVGSVLTQLQMELPCPSHSTPVHPTPGRTLVRLPLPASV